MHITANKSILIGVISDTHNLLRTSVRYIFKDCSAIIHAGDIGGIEILNDLEKISPLVAIRGNTDREPYFNNLPESKAIDLHGVSFYIIHDINKLDIDLISEDTKIIVSGHTHKPLIYEQDGVKYINPGSSGYQRIGCPITLGLISLKRKIIDMQIIKLD